VKGLNLQVTAAKAKLAAATQARLDADNMLDIQTEAGTRLQIAEQRKRV